MMDRRNFLRTASSFTLLTVGATTDASRTTGESIGKYLNLDLRQRIHRKTLLQRDSAVSQHNNHNCRYNSPDRFPTIPEFLLQPG